MGGDFDGGQLAYVIMEVRRYGHHPLHGYGRSDVEAGVSENTDLDLPTLYLSGQPLNEKKLPGRCPSEVKIIDVRTQNPNGNAVL